MESNEIFISLGVALGVGMLIGLEREQARVEETENKDQPLETFLGGVRTHPLFALGGAIAMILSRELGSVFFIVTMLGFMSFVVISYVEDTRRARDRGITSQIAFLMSFLLGSLTQARELIEPMGSRLILASSIAVVTTLLLSLKVSLHRLVRKMSNTDLLATTKFLVVALVALPLLPNESYGPLGAFNPFKTGLMICLIAGIGFVGYVLLRVLGPGRGLGITGLVGGIASSTAVTLNMSARAKTSPSFADGCALAIMLAASVMAPRVLIAVGAVSPKLVLSLALPLVLMTLGSLAAALFFYRRAKSSAQPEAAVSFTNPFELSSALKFGLLYAIVQFAARAAAEYLGNAGLYLTGVLAGTTDVDPVVLSVANLDGNRYGSSVAVTTILLALASNTVVKAGMAIGVGGWSFGRRVAAGYLLSMTGGVIGWVILQVLNPS